MIEIVALLFILLTWFGYRGYIKACEYIVEKIIIVLSAGMLIKNFMRLV